MEKYTTGLKVIKSGAIKRVGDGKTVKMWEDPWLPTKWDRRPFTPRRNVVVTTTDKLINHHGDVG